MTIVNEHGEQLIIKPGLGDKWILARATHRVKTKHVPACTSREAVEEYVRAWVAMNPKRRIGCKDS